MASGGYDFELVDSSTKDYECPICLLLLRETMELPCSHTLCKVCLGKWERERVLKLCPSCKAVYSEENVTKSRFADRIITSTLKVKCKENMLGCNLTGVILDYDEHETKCAFKSVECNFPGCKTKVLRSKVDEHTKECPFRFIRCEYCGEEEQFNKIQEHHVSCLYYPVACINEGCELVLQWNKLPHHLDVDCEFQRIHCDYEFVGCHSTFQKRLKEKHNQESTLLHMKMVLDHSKQTALTVTELQKDFLKTKKELSLTKQESVEMKKELVKIRKEFNDYKVEVQVTIQDLKTKSMGKEEQNIEHSRQSLQREIDYLKREFVKTANESDELSNDVLETSLRLSALVLQPAESFLHLIPQENFDKHFKGEEKHKSSVEILKMEKFQDVTEKRKNLNIQLDERLQNIQNVPSFYAVRFKKILEMMETWKLYKVGDQMYVKFDVRMQESFNLRFNLDFIQRKRNNPASHQRFKGFDTTNYINNPNICVVSSSAELEVYRNRNDDYFRSHFNVYCLTDMKRYERKILHPLIDGVFFRIRSNQCFSSQFNYYMANNKHILLQFKPQNTGQRSSYDTINYGL